MKFPFPNEGSKNSELGLFHFSSDILPHIFLTIEYGVKYSLVFDILSLLLFLRRAILSSVAYVDKSKNYSILKLLIAYIY